MSLAIDIVDGRGLINETRRRPKKTKVMCVKSVITTVKSIITTVLEYKASLTLKFKCVCVAMCSLVTSLFSHDF